MARFLILRRLWGDLGAWSNEPTAWIRREISAFEDKPERAFSEAGRALKRRVGAGVSLADVGQVAQMVAFEATFNALNLIDECGG